MASDRLHNNFYLIMLSGAILMFGTEMVAILSGLAEEDSSPPVYALIIALVGIIILERLAAISISRPLHGSLYAICAVTLVSINQFLLSDGPTMFGYSGASLPSAIFFYAGSALYFLSVSVLFIKTGARTKWR